MPGDPADTGGGVFPNVKDAMPKTFDTVGSGAPGGRVPTRSCCCEVEGVVVAGTKGENVRIGADLFGTWPNELLAGGGVAGR